MRDFGLRDCLARCLVLLAILVLGGFGCRLLLRSRLLSRRRLLPEILVLGGLPTNSPCTTTVATGRDPSSELEPSAPRPLCCSPSAFGLAPVWVGVTGCMVSGCLDDSTGRSELMGWPRFTG